MENQPSSEIMRFLYRVAPPLILSIMVKVASDYKKGKRISWMSSIVIVLLAGCGAIVGYWVTQYLKWTEYKMTLTIFAFGIFADKMFEILFSKTFLNGMFNYLEDMIKENLSSIVKHMKNKDTDT